MLMWLPNCGLGWMILMTLLSTMELNDFKELNVMNKLCFYSDCITMSGKIIFGSDDTLHMFPHKDGYLRKGHFTYVS